MSTVTFTADFDVDEFIRRIAAETARQLGHARVDSPAARNDAPTTAGADPWDSAWPDTPDAAPGAATPPRNAPAAGSGGRAQPGAVVPPPMSGTQTINTPKGPQQWTIGAANAPNCLCGNAAAYIQGFTNGKPWKRWGCALGADSTAWRDKCNFSEWA